MGQESEAVRVSWQKNGERSLNRNERVEANAYKVDEPVGSSVFRIDSLTPTKSPRQLLVA